MWLRKGLDFLESSNPEAEGLRGVSRSDLRPFYTFCFLPPPLGGEACWAGRTQLRILSHCGGTCLAGRGFRRIWAI